MAYKPKKSAVTKIQERNFYGPEPDIASDFSAGDSKYLGALNWYNIFFEVDVGVEWLDTELRARKFHTKDISAIKRSGLISQNDCVVARLISRECKLSERTLQRWNERIQRALKYGRLKREEMLADPERESPAVRNRRKAFGFTADLDELMDQVWLNEVKLADIKFFEVFKQLDIKPSQASIILPNYKEQLVEMADKDVSHQKKTVHQRLVAFTKGLVEALEAWAGTTAEEKLTKKVGAVKRGRKPKAVRPAATTKNLKFKKIDEETKLTSIDPRQILGAQMLVIYNAKYKQLAILRATNAEGLSVKGTTILNVDEKTSEAKRAGRHLTAIKEMASAPKTKIAKLFQSINSTPIEFRTRTSEDIILVRAIK
jgi:hypothetical protein